MQEFLCLFKDRFATTASLWPIAVTRRADRHPRNC
jgi:hypothetical protein